MLLINNILLTSLLLLQSGSRITCAKPTNVTYSNATLQIAKATQMAAYMNLDADPCEDFYEWACGKWSVSHPASAAKQKTSFVELLKNLYVQKCVKALQEPKSNTSDPHVFLLDNMLKTVYASCHLTDEIKNVGFAPIWHTLELQAGWPLISDTEWFETEYDWLKVVVLAKRKFNTEIFIGFNVVNDLQNPETSRIQFGAPKLSLNDTQIYLAAEHAATRDNYRGYIETKLQYFFPAMSNAWSQEIASQVLQVEEKLAKVIANRTNEQTPLERYVAELKVSYGTYVDLSRYLKLMLDRTVNDKVYETPKGYFKGLIDVVRLTPKLTLANYTLWKILDKFDLGGDKVFCAHKMMNLFPYETEYLFQRSYWDDDLVDEVQNTFELLRRSLHDQLENSERFKWILPQTLNTLSNKLSSMSLQFAQPQDHSIFYRSSMRTYTMKLDQYFQNIINILEWQNIVELVKLNSSQHFPSTPTSSPLLPTYNSQTHSVEVPVIFMQSRFLWDPAYPTSIGHGTITFLLAQQIAYALSDDDSDTDAHKAWDIASELRLTKRSSCYAQQPHYAVKEYHSGNVADRQRLKKAIMDNGGLSIAYRLYDQMARDKRPDALGVLPKLPNSHLQQFFLAYAQLFCADYPEEVSEYGDLPEALRVNGAVANLAEFSKSFECSDTSSLNPKEKCEIF